jgi:glycosyltransferase 2 family protein
MRESITYFLSLLRKRGFTIIITVVIFYILLATYANAKQFIRYVHNINIVFLPLILLCFSASIILRSIRQNLILRYIGINLRFKENLILYAAGLVMTITPASLGQVIKSHYLLKYYNQRISKTLPIVLVERYHDVLALLSFIIIFVAINKIDILVTPIFVIAVLLIGVTIIVKYNRPLVYFQGLLSKINFIKNLGYNLFEFNQTLLLLFRRESICYIWFVSMCAWFFEAMGILVSFEALKLDFSFGLATALGFSSILFGALSFIPGGLGVTEVSFVTILSSYGLEIAVSTAVILLIRLSSTWYSTVIGIIATKFISKK